MLKKNPWKKNPWKCLGANSNFMDKILKARKNALLMQMLNYQRLLSNY
jgi:hypothetical protein